MTLQFPTSNPGPIEQEDPNGIFPALDDIAPIGPVDVPTGFDLVAILSESMRSRPQWRDMAAASSRIIHEYVERTRLALQLARDPRALARTLKIATLKMIGVNWSSDLLSDADYDRMLVECSEFLQQNGPRHFARYMGYALGVPMDLIPLWTRDYAAFLPGPPMVDGDLVTDANGTAYPTSHGDIVYELFSTRGGIIDSYQADVRSLFEEIAPLHLVLNWIAAQISLSVGTLYLGICTYDDGDDSVVVDDPSTAVVTDVGHVMINGANGGAPRIATSRVVIGGTAHDPQPSDTMVVGEVLDVTSGISDLGTTGVGTYNTGRGTQRFVVRLGSDVGGWSIATVGIYGTVGVSSESLVAVASFPIIGTKRADDLPRARGDVRTLIIYVPCQGTPFAAR